MIKVIVRGNFVSRVIKSSNYLLLCTIYSTVVVVKFFKDKQPNYCGKEHDLFLLEECSKSLKKSGAFYRVLARVKKICETGHFGKKKKRVINILRKKILGGLSGRMGQGCIILNLMIEKLFYSQFLAVKTLKVKI